MSDKPITKVELAEMKARADAATNAGWDIFKPEGMSTLIAHTSADMPRLIAEAEERVGENGWFLVVRRRDGERDRETLHYFETFDEEVNGG